MSDIDHGPAVRSNDNDAEAVSADAIDLLQGFVQEVIMRCRAADSRPGKPWCLYTRGHHPSQSHAARQERAVKVYGG